MRYSILAFIASAAAAPFTSTGGAALCPTGLYSNPQCCATDVLGVVGLNCAVPATTPTSTTDFIAGCAASGQQAKCCVIPVADQDVLCQDVSPGAGGSPGSPGTTPSPSPAPPAESPAPEEPSGCPHY
ncbi:fungal hydrophobin-domain-containing protein [Alternaria rosae]|uniref:fungal hydrophobin-domain-containing protein n=1 Tax=Alternaria rosae TaxID=1187941 RepID=UPI001E8E2E9F|nr:fungal hydrophobin-domain-containing protein [Alternaria rosae]KAH6876093.1 fungal hydrophobin-domain-containing protein [Alternaria rosae]